MKLFTNILASYLFALVLAAPAEHPGKNDEVFVTPLNLKDKDDLSFVRETVINKLGELTDENFEELSKLYSKSSEVEIVSGPFLKQDLTLPVSNCLVSYQGTGGSIGYSGSFSVTASGSITPGLAEPIASTISLSGSVTVAKTLGTTLSYSCTASSGGVAQLLATPIYVSFEYRSKVSYFNSLSGEVINAAKWSEVKSGAMPVLQTPVFHCVNASAAVCFLPPSNITLPTTL